MGVRLPHSHLDDAWLRPYIRLSGNVISGLSETEGLRKEPFTLLREYGSVKEEEKV
jgi:hypothetical protein